MVQDFPRYTQNCLNLKKILFLHNLEDISIIIAVKYLNFFLRLYEVFEVYLTPSS